MGLTHVEAEVSSAAGRQRVLFLVDSGAGYSLLPQEVWRNLALSPSRTVTVALADGTKLKRDVAECRFNVQDVEAASPVLLGEPGDEPLLGAITLENLGFVLDPFQRTLRPMQVRL